MWGVKGMQNKLVEKQVSKLIEGVSKEDFLLQLKDAWMKEIKKNGDLEVETSKAMYRINNSGPYKKGFDKLGITEEDISEVVRQIQEEKIDPITKDPVPGRNEPCSCGSELKYKKCCGK